MALRELQSLAQSQSCGTMFIGKQTKEGQLEKKKFIVKPRHIEPEPPATLKGMAADVILSVLFFGMLAVVWVMTP